MVIGGINYSFPDAEQRERKQLWTNHQSKLSPEKETVYAV
jgi:hypothetical protein